MNFTIPDAIFEEPVYEAKIELPDITRKGVPAKIEVAENIKKSLEKTFGLKVKLEMPGLDSSFTDELREI